MTLRELSIILRGKAKGQKAEMHRMAGLTYTLAQLISYATHDPKKMPKFDKVFPDGDKKPVRQSAEEIAAVMMAWAGKLGAAR